MIKQFYLMFYGKIHLDIIRPGGTGIGLYVFFNLIRMMNSKIEIDSEVGKGSTFTVKFPLYLEQDIKTS